MSAPATLSSQQFVQYIESGFDEVFPAVVPDPIVYAPSQFSLTKLGMKVSTDARIFGRENVKFVDNCVMQSECIVRADLRRVELGSYCYLDTRCILRPFSRMTSTGMAFFPLKLGNFVYIGSDTVVEAASVGNYCVVEANAVLGSRCQLSDICKVLRNSVVLPDTVIPSYAVYGGNPAVYVRSLPEGARSDIVDLCTLHYNNVVVKDK